VGFPASTHQRSAVIAATGLRSAPLDEVLDTLAVSLALWLEEWNRRVAAGAARRARALGPAARGRGAPRGLDDTEWVRSGARADPKAW
jgi:hypothetical protein